MSCLFDTHAHYFDARFTESGEDVEALLSELLSTSVCGILNVGTSLENAGAVLAQVARHERMHAAIGIHPTDGEVYPEPAQAVADLERLLSTRESRFERKLVALGEIGLDYHLPDADREKQRQLLELQLSLAERLELPVIIHDRDAHGDCFEAVLRHKGVRGVFHSFSGSAELATELTRRGWYLSFSGVITFRNAPRVRAAAAAVPLDRLLIETDAPYLAPVPHRGERNHSGYLSLTAQTLAQVKGVSPEELARVTCQNACRLFALPLPDSGEPTGG